MHECSVVSNSCDPMDCSPLMAPPRSSVHRIFQARILERVAISFFRQSNLHLSHCQEDSLPLSHMRIPKAHLKKKLILKKELWCIINNLWNFSYSKICRALFKICILYFKKILINNFFNLVNSLLLSSQLNLNNFYSYLSDWGKHFRYFSWIFSPNIYISLQVFWALY